MLPVFLLLLITKGEFDLESLELDDTDELALGDYNEYFEDPVGDFDPYNWDLDQSNEDEYSDEELDLGRPFVPAHGMNHPVGETWQGFDVKDHLFDPDVPEKTIGDEDPLQAFFDHVEKKYDSISLKDVQRNQDDEFPLGLEELLTPEMIHELEIGAALKDEEKEKRAEEDQKKEEKASKRDEELKKKAAKNQSQEEDKDEEEEDEKIQKKLQEAARKAGEEDELTVNKKVMLRFLKKILGSCPYNVRVEFVRRFKARYGNAEKRKIILETVQKFGETMKAYVEGRTNLSEQTQQQIVDARSESIANAEKQREEEEAKRKEEEKAGKDEIKKKLS